MKLALPSLPSHSTSRLRRISLPTRRRQSTPKRALAVGTKALKGGLAVKAGRGAARHTRTTLAFPLLALGGLVMLLRRRLRGRTELTFDAPVTAPAPVSQTPQAAASDPSPANPETDLPAAPNGASETDEQRETAKAAVTDQDAPNEGAPGHEPS